MWSVENPYNYDSSFQRNVKWCEFILNEESRNFSKGKDGEIRYGDITEEGYKYDEGREGWYKISELDTLLYVCTINHDGEKAKEKNNDSTVFFCYRGAWIEEIGSIYGILRDSRDGQKYRTVTIGKQEWMAENLNYDPDYIDNVFGGYYWKSRAKEVCPEGWHLPSVDEWNELFQVVESSFKLMTRFTCSIHEPSYNTAACWLHPQYGYDNDDAYGFSAIPAGSEYDNRHIDACFWSVDGSDIKMLSLQNSTFAETEGMSPIRCVKD